jgi:cytosine/adenosine deaminase-related metal-dependent hydrolase
MTSWLRCWILGLALLPCDTTEACTVVSLASSFLARSSSRMFCSRDIVGGSKLMGPDLVFSHGGWMTDDELAAVLDSGAGIVGTPDTTGYPMPICSSVSGVPTMPAPESSTAASSSSVIQCHAGLGLDITSNQGNDFMAQMRLALQAQRAREYDHRTVGRDLRRKAVDALRMATLGGAEVMSLPWFEVISSPRPA